MSVPAAARVHPVLTKSHGVTFHRGCDTGYRLQWCHTDLGANAFNFTRLISEDKRFGALAQHSNGLTADHYDGVMAQAMLNSGAVLAWLLIHALATSVAGRQAGKPYT